VRDKNEKTQDNEIKDLKRRKCGWWFFLLAMTDAICAPEEKTKDKIQKTVQHQLGSLL
jgi:hypothetical protein